MPERIPNQISEAIVTREFSAADRRTQTRAARSWWDMDAKLSTVVPGDQWGMPMGGGVMSDVSSEPSVYPVKFNMDDGRKGSLSKPLK